jgi:CO/xanthine dehydrogenase Mo-binding subunit
VQNRAVTLDNGAGIVHSAPTQRLTFAEAAAAASAGQRSLRAQKLYRVSQSSHMSPCTTQVVEVEVDPDTGQVKLLDVVTAHDVGTIINPLGHQGQIEGGLMQGIGSGLLEGMRTDEGRVGTLSLGEYTLPNIKDIPPRHTVLAQEELGPAPFQGKAIGESSITPIAAALANAVCDAVGVRLHDLPITAEKVYHEIQTREGRTL